MKNCVLVPKDQEIIKVQNNHPKNILNITSILSKGDVNIGRFNLSMKLPKIIVGIKLPSKKKKSKLDDTDESKTNTKLHINNKIINVQDKDNIPKTFTLIFKKKKIIIMKQKQLKIKIKRNTVKEQVNHG